MGKTTRPPKHVCGAECRALQEFSRDPAARPKAKRKCAASSPSRAFARIGRDLSRGDGGSMTCTELLALLRDIADALGTKVRTDDDAPPDRRYERLRAAVLKLKGADSGLNRANAWVAVNNALGG